MALISYIEGILERFFSYNRFIELKPRLILPLMIFLHLIKGKKTGIYFADSTKIVVCHNKRSNPHKTFKDLATFGISSYGWFYGFKLHIILNDKRQIIAAKITEANCDDRAGLTQIIKGLKGKIYADKGILYRTKIFSKIT